MKKSTKTILTTLMVAAAIGGGVALVARMREQKTPPQPVAPGDVPQELLGGALEAGWTSYGMYTYKGKSDAKMWIRVDRGPAEAGTVLDDIPWRWTIFVNKPAPEGYVPIATGTKTWSDLGVLYRIDAVKEYADDEMAQLVLRAAADQIDAMYGGES